MPLTRYLPAVTEHDLERRAQIAQVLLGAARVLGETLEPERVYERFQALLADAIAFDGVVVSSYDERDDLIRCEYAWTDGAQLDVSVFPPLTLNREGEGMQSRVIVSGEPLIENEVAELVQRPGGTYYDVDKSGKLRKLPESGPTKTRAAMMVPVKLEGRVVGVMQLMSTNVAYSEEQLELVEGLVGQLATAVRNARLQQERSRLEAAEAAARATAAEREQAANVLQAVGDGIFLLSDDGVIGLWNRAAEIITGLPAENAVGSDVHDAFPEWADFGSHVTVAEDGAGAESLTFPVSARGRELWLSFVAVRSTDGVVYAFRDVTGERRLDEEKSELIATISHELRTPMAAVYGAAETLRRRGEELTPEGQRQLVEMISAQASRLARITQDVLLATELDRGGTALEREPVDVVEVVRSAIETIGPALPPTTDIEVDVAPSLAVGSAVRDRLQQVLVNLLDNAVKYGGDEISVRLEGVDGVVRILVFDSGPGIAAAEQQRIFEKFYRSGPPLMQTQSGTGLGLYISRELVQLMGGRLEVQSQPGAGTTFVIELPRA